MGYYIMNFFGPSQGTTLYQGSGTDANGTHNYENTMKDPPVPAAIPMALPNLAKTLWIYADTWASATVQVQISFDGEHCWTTLADDNGNTSFTADTRFNVWAAGALFWRTIVSNATSGTENVTSHLTFGN